MMIPSVNLSFTIGTLVGQMSGRWNQKGWDRLSWWSLRLWGEGGGVIFAECLHGWGRRAMSLLNYTLAFEIQLRKSTQNLSQVWRVVRNHSLLWFGCFSGAAKTGLLIISPPRLHVGVFSQPSVGTSAFQVSELRGSPHQLTLSRNSVSALMWSAECVIPKSLWNWMLPTYQSALVAMRRHFNCNTCNFRTYLRAANVHFGHA
jgi:hypothetical protein